MYNLQISYPDDNIIVHANDIKSYFRQIRYHPNVAGAFSYILGEYLFVQIGLAFAANLSPANWEDVRRVQSTLAKKLFSNTSLVHKHRAVLNKIKWCCSPNGQCKPCFTGASCNSLSPSIWDVS